MKQEDKQYEKWLAELKSRQPMPAHPEELTMAILNKITEISSQKKRIKYLIGAWVSGIAATLLLLLFINDTLFSPLPSEAERQNKYENWQSGASIALPENWEEMRMTEKKSYLSSQYMQHTERRKVRQMRIFHIIKENRLK